MSSFGLSHILFNVHYINVMWKKKKIIKIGEVPQARLLSPGMLLTISHKTTFLFMDLESI